LFQCFSVFQCNLGNYFEKEKQQSSAQDHCGGLRESLLLSTDVEGCACGKLNLSLRLQKRLLRSARLLVPSSTALVHLVHHTLAKRDLGAGLLRKRTDHTQCPHDVLEPRRLALELRPRQKWQRHSIVESISSGNANDLGEALVLARLGTDARRKGETSLWCERDDHGLFFWGLHDHRRARQHSSRRWRGRSTR